jgi:copper chaperone CopZ
MKTNTISINGMSCSACEKVVTKRLSSLPGVQHVSVDVENGKATAQSENELSQEAVEAVLKDTHYTVANIQNS